MVETIAVRDAFRVPFDPQTVFDALIRFEDYPRWWPARFKVRADVREGRARDDAVLFCVGPAVWVGWERERTEAPRSVAYRYHVGPHRGSGCWSLSARDDGGTELVLAIEITPKNLPLALLYRTMRVPRKHSRDIRLLVEALCAHLGQ